MRAPASGWRHDHLGGETLRQKSHTPATTHVLELADGGPEGDGAEEAAPLAELLARRARERVCAGDRRTEGVCPGVEQQIW